MTPLLTIFVGITSFATGWLMCALMVVSGEEHEANVKHRTPSRLETTEASE